MCIRDRALLRTMFRLAVAWGYLQTCPATNISMFPETSRDRFVQPDELPRLLTAIKEQSNPYIKSALMMCLLTGARRSEVLSAQWPDVDLTAGRSVSYTHLRAHETDSYLVCRLLL